MVEITVRGAGIFGLSIAWACVQRGARVQVIDPYGPAAGASGGVVGALAPHVPENWNTKKQFQRDSLVAAREFWPMVDAISGIDSGYSRLGRLQPIADEKSLDVAQKRIAGAQEHWGALAQWVIVDQVPDWVPPCPMRRWIWDDMTARINPQMACLSLAKALRHKGCPIIVDGDDRGQVVWATGAHDLSYISQQIGQDVGRGEKGQAAVFDLDLRDSPQLYIDSLHVTPHRDGTTAIGSTSERHYNDPAETDQLLDALIAKARALVPVLANAPVLRVWAGARPRAKTRAPVLGSHPVYRDAFIANGGFKIGFGMALGVAEVMADLVVDGIDRIPDDFRTEHWIKG